MYRLYVEFVNQDPHGGWVPFGGVAVVAERLNGFRDGLGKLILRLSGDVQPGMRVGFQYGTDELVRRMCIEVPVEGAGCEWARITMSYITMIDDCDQRIEEWLRRFSQQVDGVVPTFTVVVAIGGRQR